MEPYLFALLAVIFTTGVFLGVLIGRKVRQPVHDVHEAPVYVGASNISGRGVFATRDIGNGDMIERCPVLELNEEDIGGELINYVFYGENEKTRLVAMGSGMLFNHSSFPNVAYYLEKTPLGPELVIYALRDIKKGEEMFYSYGDEWWSSRNIREIT